MALLKLSELLEKGMPGITSKKVKLVRHATDKMEIDGKPVPGDPYSLFISNHEHFLKYQSEQTEDVFKDIDYIVSFIAEEGTTARMIGVFKVDGYDLARKAKNKLQNKFYYKLTDVEDFKEKKLSERIIIDWGKGTRSWWQWLKHGDDDKDVIAIEKQGVEWKYPSYEEIILPFEQLERIIEGNGGIWKHKLTAVKGIYVISDQSTGNLYVGSAYQEKNGLWGRWEKYVKTKGTGDNKLLKKLIDKDPDYARKYFQWGILQTCPLRIADQDILQLEKTWKKKLGKKACALNGN